MNIANNDMFVRCTNDAQRIFYA